MLCLAELMVGSVGTPHVLRLSGQKVPHSSRTKTSQPYAFFPLGACESVILSSPTEIHIEQDTHLACQTQLALVNVEQVG